MRHINITLWIICFLLFPTEYVFGQWQNFEGIILTEADSIKALSITELKLPEDYLSGRKSELPWKLNNAELPFFRPIFNQVGSSCGQASGIGYNFTYEINRARGLDALYLENQYPTQFTWNFMNGGSGWRGVSYFHSFELLEACGTPNIATYGGLAAGGDLRWMSGYDEYYSAMKNRIDEVHYIDVSSVEGLLTLKHWLNDHLDGSEFGGVASYYASSPFNHKQIPNESPESGKRIIVDWIWPAIHAMTIVGYNDSIRYDWNMDGQFTNDIDINGDEIVDIKDWEIGALLFANSYGDYWADSGYCYMMYKSLAVNYEDGGIWNNSVHVISVKENYSPMLTMRVKLKYNSREKIKIVVGVSSDTMSLSPSYSMDFPLLDFQGGNMPLQGLPYSDTLDPEVMELELDVTPLLGYVNPGENARYFFQIIENDPKAHGWGEIQYYSLVDRTSGFYETTNLLTPIPIINNSITTLSIVSSILFDKPTIQTEELPVWAREEDYNLTMEASGGQAPYKWSLMQSYSLNAMEKDFPEVNGDRLTFGDQDVGSISFDLAFPFPFYGDTMNKVEVALDGLVSFEGEDFAYPYYFGESTLLTERKVIAAFMANLWLANNNNNGVWVYNTPEYFEVIWKATYNHYNAVVDGDFNFALRLYPNGNIETYYGDFIIPSYVMWVSGISNGDKTNYTENQFAHHLQNLSGSSFKYTPLQLPDNVRITKEGELFVSVISEDVIYNITAQVKDYNRLIDRKTFQLSSGMIFHYEIHSGVNDQIEFSDTTSLTLIAKNISGEAIESIDFQALIEDQEIMVLTGGVELGSFAAGETKQFDSAVVFRMSETIRDKYNFIVSSQLSNEENSWNSDVCMTVGAMNINIVDVIVENENNGRLEPGETADLKIEIQNLGHASGTNLDFRFVANSNYLTVNTTLNHIDFLPVGGKTMLTFNVSTPYWTPSGIKTASVLELFSGEENIQSIYLPLTIGKVPVLILNLEETSASADHFSSIFDSLHLQYEFRTTFPEDLDDYYSVFVCLGDMFKNYELKSFEGNKLVNFLMNGGNIYMEGMRTWKEDVPTAVHNAFNIDIVYDVNYFPFDSLYGVENETTHGLVLGYGGSMAFINHHLKPKGSASPFLRFAPSDSASVIAHDTLGYKTIGSSVLFGPMFNTGSSFATAEYINAILEFFEITIQVEGIAEDEFMEDPLHFEVFPNPFTNSLKMKFFSSGEENSIFRIFDLHGRLIKMESIPFIYPDQYVEMIWDGHNKKGEKQLPGIYFVNYIAGKHSSIQKVILR